MFTSKFGSEDNAITYVDTLYKDHNDTQHNDTQKDIAGVIFFHAVVYKVCFKGWEN